MSDERPRLGKGIRLRHEDAGTMLLVPEGVLELNATAAAALSLVDGTRTLAQIAAQICERFDVSDDEAQEAIAALFARLRERGFVE